ncbi:zinc-dependent metalloprotease family protein [Aliiglaciecola sp. CAU 1673]|nr:zinc-dependent metalloprotease family protein [Aliiglaciecola sp. CAU 1673]
MTPWQQDSKTSANYTATSGKPLAAGQPLKAAYHADSLFDIKNNQLQVKTGLSFGMITEKPLQALMVRYYQREDNKLVWLGKIQGEPGSSVNLIASQTQLTGNIRTKGKLYQLRTQADGAVVITEFVPPAQAQNDVQAAPVNTPRAASSKTFNSALPLHTTSSASGFAQEADVKVLVYYSRQALEQTPDLLDVIDLEFIDTNQAFANSNIDASVAVVEKIQVDELTLGNDPFTDFSSKRGTFANVEQVREKYQADLVHFYPSYLRGACGLAFYSVFPNGGTAKYWGYGATAAWCTGNFITAHELGHNFGAAHDRHVENGGDENSNYGYVDVENRFKTVMAYPNKCSDQGEYCETIAHFSNPEVLYNDVPTGIAVNEPEAADNAAMLNFSALSIANYQGVGAPVITQITQGDNQAIELQWQAVEGATGYRVHRREADTAGIQGPICSYPVYGDEFDVEQNHFVDAQAQPQTTYCYSVTALNSNLLDNLSSPSSLVRSGYATNAIQLPYIEDIVITEPTSEITHTLALPQGNWDYRVELVEHSDEYHASVSLTGPELTISDFSAKNQTLMIALFAKDNASSQQAVQLFNVQIAAFDNQPAQLQVETNQSMNQQTVLTIPFTLSDDQAIQRDAVYAYSTNEKLISKKDVSVSMDNQGNLSLSIEHKNLNAGDVDIVIGYSDGEYNATSTVKLKVVRTIFNPAQVQDVTWYVEQGMSVTRLLPLFDIDTGEQQQIEIVSAPSQGSLAWPLPDKATYTANADFTEDSFSFQVIGEDGERSATATVTIKPMVQQRIAAKQKLVSTYSTAAFLSHTGSLYTWGANASGQSGLGAAFRSQNTIAEPHKVPGNDWADVAVQDHLLVAIKKDGTLWRVGYDFFSRQQYDELTQFGSANDWRSVHANNTTLVLTKSDGSVWGRGYNGSNELSERSELTGDIESLQQIISLYGVTQLSHTQEAGFALTTDNQVYSWGSNRLDVMGRENGSGYLAPIHSGENVHNLQAHSFRGTFLDGNRLYVWGGGSLAMMLGYAEDLPTPTLISNDNWVRISLGGGHFAGIMPDNSLWTWGGYTNRDTGLSDSPQLARGQDARSEIAQVGDRTEWLEAWASDALTYTLDMQGNIWVSGGDASLNNRFPFGLVTEDSAIYSLTKIDAIPASETGVTDNDSDGLRDYMDTDDDNDGTEDQNDAFPLDATEWLDTDGDGIGNNADTDDDNDGVPDTQDAFPLDATESADTDGDGIGNNADPDDDNDGVPDTQDAFPLDATESVDTDGDGIGNNADTDDDNDGVPDAQDAFPLDATESVDTDGDGIGNNADTDDDNDGVPDAQDAYPLDPSRSTVPTPTPPSQPDTQSSGGGSLGGWALLLLLTLIRNRRLP